MLSKQFIRSVRAGDLELAELAVESPEFDMNFTTAFDINGGDENFSPLMFAIFERQESIVRLLLEKGANPNLESNQDVPLTMAFFRGEFRIADVLEEFGANLNTSPSSERFTNLEMAFLGAAHCRYPELGQKWVKKLIDANHTVRDAAYIVSSISTNMPLLGIFVESGFDINSLGTWSKTGLCSQASIGNVFTLGNLLLSGADIDCSNAHGQSPLCIAILEGKGENAEFLIEQGANVNTQDYKGNTPLHYAAKNFQSAVVSLLKEHGADPEIKNCKGENVLQYITPKPNKKLQRMMDLIKM